VDAADVFDGLNDEQRLAVEAVRGPVVILAGAGSGKTTTITRRIANQVATGTFEPSQILAMTFTDKAAEEMRRRLAALGVQGVAARTFHSAALQQLHRFGRDPGRVLPSKVLVLRPLMKSLPKAFRFRPAADVATEIEWARNRRVPVARYEEAAEGRTTPIPVDLMARLYRQYETRKREAGLIDFEDLLELAIRAFEENGTALAEFRDGTRALTVDEFQDVNLLQATLLGLWLGGRDDLCVVGDDHQAIYSFTGATPRYLLAMERRFPHAAVIRLEQNYRSTPEVLALANRLTPRLGGVEKTLRTTRPGGPEPQLLPFASREAEESFVVSRIRELAAGGTPYEEIAILYRLNSRSDDWEEALAQARIPFVVRGGAFLRRPAARRLRQVLGRSTSTAVVEDVRAAALEEGLLEPIPEDLGDQETTRQHDLARLIALAHELDDGERTVAGFFEALDRRFGENAEGEGVNLLTLHRAKGLEFDGVFLPRLEEGDLPVRQAKDEEAVDEERRLLYVGITRARRDLALTWTGTASRFLEELGAVTARPPAEPRRRAAAEREPEPNDPVYRALKRWRAERATADAVPAYVVFHNSTLAEIARRAPTTLWELGGVPGVGPAKLDRYGEAVLATLVAER
jgi:DNA helicase-2/ATP-dependent DNA helicase PcrA